MGIANKLPGMRPGSWIRNIIVGVVYLFGIMIVMGMLLGGAGTDSASDSASTSDGGDGSGGADESSDSSDGGDDSGDGESDSSSDESDSDSSGSDSGDSDSSDSGSDDADSSDSGSDDSDSSDSSSDGSQSSDSEDSSETTYSVRVIYDGEWSGSVGADGSSRSVDGSGEETFEIEGDPMSISANAQKNDDSSDELTIQILEDGEVVAEQSTTAEYGVAQTSYSNF